MASQQLQYSNGNKNYIGYLAWDEKQQGARPGILVIPDAFGLGEHARERADRLAQAGYVALAADIHGDGFLHADLASAISAIQAMYADRAAWRAMATAAFDALSAQPNVDRARLGAIGFCFGGTTCLELARTGAAVGVIAAFHAGLNAPLAEDAGRIRAKVLINHGAEDPLVKPEAIAEFMAEMRREAIDWQFVHHGNTVHSFTEPTASRLGAPAFAYNKSAEDRSWAAMRQLFDETFEAR
ncbi:dienelactone hydrolase family protein [Povalibacter sp.]|uniref:dienelactone hydrolase family protein n=1 Tax=Povalibacter sp. TaxID=1962978 RepID=UPI002F42B0F0